MLDTGVKFVRNPGGFVFGEGSVDSLSKVVASAPIGVALIFIDQNVQKFHSLSFDFDHIVFGIDTSSEPSTRFVDELKSEVILKLEGRAPGCCVSIGGGSTLDVGKAISNLLNNPGKASDYQGWDLVKEPGVYKIGIPTIPGTGAEATRTCVMTNYTTKLKLGMNSDHTVYDYLILDPNLSSTVERTQYFYTAMDAYIHCIESLNGSYRNPIGDSYSSQVIKICEEVFSSSDFKSSENRSKMYVASYLGGMAIATSYVGLIHPISAALSVVLGTHHCVGNCIAFRGVENWYPAEYKQFWEWADMHNITIPKLNLDTADDELMEALVSATLMHEKPLYNALGSDYLNVLTTQTLIEIFGRL